RPGRAIALSVAAFVAVADAWPFVFLSFLLDPLRDRLVASGLLSGGDPPWWLGQGGAAVWPRPGPGPLLNRGREAPGANRWMFTLLVLGWCLLAGALAVALYGEVLATFDRKMGRMPEAGGEGRDDDSRRLVPELAGCQNGGRWQRGTAR